MGAIATALAGPADQQVRKTTRLCGGPDHRVIPQDARNLVLKAAACGGIHRRLLVALHLPCHRARRLAPVAPFEQGDAIMERGEAIGLGNGVNGEDHPCGSSAAARLPPAAG